MVMQSVIVQASGVKECLFHYDEKNSDSKIVTEILKRCGVVLTPVKNRDFNSQDIEQDLTRLLGKLTNNLGIIPCFNCFKFKKLFICNIWLL